MFKVVKCEMVTRKVSSKGEADPLADVLGLLADGLGVGDGVVGDGGEELLLVLPVEGRLAHQHLVEQHPVRPPGQTYVFLLEFKLFWYMAPGV